jgi:23S rRNA pseudouridine1911/1915/1917 synthase
MEIFRFTVDAERDGLRLDKALCAFHTAHSRTQLKRWINDGLVRIDGRIVTKAGTFVEQGARITLEIPPEPEPAIERPEGALRILFEDDQLAVIDKQPGIAVHPNKNCHTGTIADLANERWENLPCLQGPDRPGIVHRLDRYTSGVMVLALTVGAMKSLRAQFKSRTVRKEYRALVYGVPTLDSGWVERPIGRDPSHPERMSTTPLAGREAQTFYRVLERFDGFSHLACHPRTGRTHQIRAHLTSEGFPLVGDRVYSTRSSGGVRLPEGHPPVERQFLHAWSLQFEHPGNAEAMEFNAPLPDDMRAFRDFLRAECPYRADEDF